MTIDLQCACHIFSVASHLVLGDIWYAEILPNLHVLVAFREKKLLVGSDDYGRDLTGVQNLRKKHKRLEAELAAHEPAIQVWKLTSIF